MRLAALLVAVALLPVPRTQAQDIPTPPSAPAESDQPTPPQPDQTAQPSTPAPPPAPSGDQQPPSEPISAADRTHLADEQLKQEESQRVLGVVPSFNVSYRPDAVSLTSKQKFHLAFRTVIDPVTIGSAFLVAGYHEAADDYPGFGWGVEGYMRRTGAAYLDTVTGSFIGNAIIPSVLHQDPRYFRLGHGTVTHRTLYAIAANFVCKHDNTHKWEPNYSNIFGNISAGAISNLYYPDNKSSVAQTFSTGILVTAEGAIGTIFNEFWPDLSRKFLHKDPTHGLDAPPPAPNLSSR